MRRFRSCSRGWGGTSRTTTRSGYTRPWSTELRRPYIGKGEPEGERRGQGRHSFSPRRPSAGVKGPAGRKRMPWDRAEKQRHGGVEFSSTVAKEGTFLV